MGRLTVRHEVRTELSRSDWVALALFGLTAFIFAEISWTPGVAAGGLAARTAAFAATVGSFILLGSPTARRLLSSTLVAATVVWLPAMVHVAFMTAGWTDESPVRLVAYSAALTALALPLRGKRLDLWDVPLILAAWLPAEFGLLSGADLTSGLSLSTLAPMTSGAGSIMLLRGLEVRVDHGLGRGGVVASVREFALAAAILVPGGLALDFIRPGPRDLELLPLSLLVVYVGTGLPEEILFRGVVHELCEVRLGPGRLAILASSLIFGAAHLNNGPVPNVKYAALATAAGYFYARAYLFSGRNVSAAALTHALVDAAWSHFFPG